jgi:hypothetical protein
MAIAPLAVLLGAGYATGGFMLARSFVPRVLAALATLALALSPVAMGQIFALRDFSKGPFLLWTISLIVLAARGLSGDAAGGHDRRYWLMEWTAPYGIALCQNEVVENLRQGSRP